MSVGTLSLDILHMHKMYLLFEHGIVKIITVELKMWQNDWLWYLYITPEGFTIYKFSNE